MYVSEVAVVTPVYSLYVSVTSDHDGLVLTVSHCDTDWGVVCDEIVCLPRSWSAPDPIPPKGANTKVELFHVLQSECESTVLFTDATTV